MLALRDHYLDVVGAPFIYRVQELTSRFFSIASVALLAGAILFALISSANSDETIANPATVSNDMKVHFSTGQFRTCPICGSETEEIDQGTFAGTAFRCKHMGRLRLPTTPCTKTAWPALTSGSVRSRSPGPEPPPLQVAVPISAYDFVKE